MIHTSKVQIQNLFKVSISNQFPSGKHFSSSLSPFLYIIIHIKTSQSRCTRQIFFFHKMSRLLSLVLLFICLFIIKLHFLIIRKHAFESNFSRILQVFKLVFTLSPKHTTKCLHCAAYQN